MAYRREDNIPVVWRKTPDVLTTNTLYGTTTVRSKFCPKCSTNRSITSFYMRSSETYTVMNPLERICVECRDEQKRKRLERDYIKGSTLDRFFDE